MGVDYKGKFGIGYKLDIEFYLSLNLDEKYNDVFEYFEYLEGLSEDKFEIKDIGDTYCGNDNIELFIFIKNPFKDGILGLRGKHTELYNFINAHGIIKVGKFDLFGGLHIS